MEALAVLAVLGVVGSGLMGFVVALFAWARMSRIERRVDELAREVARTRVTGEPVPARAPAAAAPRATPVAEQPPPRADVPPPFVPPRRAPAPPRPAGPSDFATNLGPKILVATGALAFMVFLALFVKYAWDNNWVGPAGRVLAGAVFGLGLLALGLRLMKTAYRPLAQGLAAAGLTGLYVSAFAAHGFYALIPREASGLLMVAIIACAVLLAVRLDARLLATLAWTGGYLTPVLLSTGEDKAVALFLYLALLDAGALIIDQRRPWPETAPLAMIGTVLLYTGWMARFFRPERFEVAAFGLVLFTTLFAFGMARKQRGIGLAVVVALASFGAMVLAAVADRPVPLLVLSLALAAAALRASLTLGRGLALLALLATGLPFVAWGVSHYREDAFGVAAAWVLMAALVFVFSERARGSAKGPGLEPLVLIGAGVAAAALCANTDRPLPVAGLLAALAGLSVLLRGKWRWAEVAGGLSVALAAALWMGEFFRAGRVGDAVAVCVPSLAIILAAMLARGLVARRPLEAPDVAAHLLVASCGWWFAYTVLEVTRPALEGPMAAAIAAGYLALGLAARRAPGAVGDLRQVRALLGLAAAFLTLAIPIQLGLHGITLGWAAEGIVLLALGLRFDSDRTRAVGYGVLILAVTRLLAFHTPLHPAEFRPLLNPAFGTWLFVIAALALALWLTRDARRVSGGLDAVVGRAAAAIALVLLFMLLTGETSATFAQQQREADALGDIAGSLAARRVGGLAVSVLWTVFATALLAGGLAARSRPLFYSAYALFAVTAAKVVGWDLDTFSTPYRMLAFLVLGLLLMAGAYLNLRFRQRMMPAPAHHEA